MPGQSKIRWFFLASALLSAAVAWGLVLPLAGAAVLAFVSEGPIDFFLAKINRQHSRRVRWLVSVGFVLLVLAGLLLPLTLAATSAISELVKLISTMEWTRASSFASGYVESARAWAADHGLDVSDTEVSAKIQSVLTEGFSFLGTRLGTLAKATPTLVFDLVILLIAWVFFAVEGRGARDRVLPRLVPWEAERAILRRTTAEVLRSVLVANVVVSVAQASLCTIALIIAGVPKALVWGTLSFFLSFVPVVGTMPVTISGAIYSYSQGSAFGAVVLVAAAALIGVVDNVLRPVFMKSSANLSFLWTLVAFIGGVALFGLPGVIIGPLAFSLFVAYLRALDEIDAKDAAKAASADDRKADAAATTTEGPPPAAPASPAPVAQNSAKKKAKRRR